MIKSFWSLFYFIFFWNAFSEKFYEVFITKFVGLESFRNLGVLSSVLRTLEVEILFDSGIIWLIVVYWLIYGWSWVKFIFGAVDGNYGFKIVYLKF